MHTTFFRGEADRSFSAAYSVEYVKGRRHPDRVMREHDLFYVTAGNQDVMQEGARYLPEEDDVLILTAGLHHWGERPCLDGSKTMYIHVSAANDRQAGDAEGAPRVPLQTLIHCGKHPEVKKTFEAIVRTFSLNDPHRALRLNTLFRTLLLALYDAQRDPSDGGSVTETVLRLIADDPQRFYSNAELAEKLFLCPRALVNRFKAETGRTPYQYQIDYKLRCVQALLTSHPDMKLRELAQDFGFYDEFHLSRTFRRAFGVPPSVWRRQTASPRADPPASP